MKNYIGQTFWLCVLVLIGIAGLSLVPEHFPIAGYPLRKMDIFADIRKDVPLWEADTTALIVPDSLANIQSDSLLADTTTFDSSKLIVGPLPPVDSMFFGSTIEDYSPDQQGLTRLFNAVDSIQSQGRTVRIAFYGDSFVEGDILIGDLRDTLQSVWGGAGVGFVPITSEVARFKRTLSHEYRGWKPYSIVKDRDARVTFGINGFVYKPEPEAKVHYEGAKYFKHTRQWSQVRLFYSAAHDLKFIWQNGGQAPHEDLLPAKSGGIQVWKWARPQPEISAFAMRFPETDSLYVYGATLESGPGIYIDNFSVRGNTGGPLKRIRPETARRFDQFQQYDLIIIQVGLNAVTNSLKNIEWYRAELDRTFTHLRACFPGKPILVVSVGDRADKQGTELVTMRSVPYIVAMQRDLARKHGFLFYDLYHGMGGPGSIITMANHKPMLANKDYTHLTHDGGRVIGYMFARLFLEEQRKYNLKKANQ